MSTKQTQTRVYEVPVVIKPLLQDDIYSKVIPAIQKLAKDLKGSATITDDWGKRHLAYSIDGIEEGHYVFFKLEIDPAKLEEFAANMTRTRDVLRFLTIKEDNL